MKIISTGLLATLLSSIAIAGPDNSALTALKNAAAGSTSMDGSAPMVVNVAVDAQSGAATIKSAKATLIAGAKQELVPAVKPIDHDAKSREIRENAIDYMMKSEKDMLDSWGKAVKILGVLPSEMAKSGAEKGFAVGGEGALGYVAAGGLGLISGIAGIPMGVAGFVGQLIAGVFVR